MKRWCVALVGVVVACGESPERGLAPGSHTAGDLRAFIPVANIRRPQEEKFVQVAAVVPTFGGYYYDRGDLVIALTDTADGGRAVALVRRDGTGSEGARHTSGQRTGRTRLVTAAFSFTQLAAWRDALFAVVIESDSVEYIDLDERANAIAVGVTDVAAERWVQGVATSLGLPQRALTVDVVAEARPFALLTERVRPVRAGLQITQRNQDLCTLGYVIRFASTAGIETGFLTNSHCSDTFWGPDQAPQFQVGAGIVADSIGREVRDVPGFACGRRGRKTCRYSDAAILGQATGNRLVGAVARPTIVTVDPGDSFGSHVIDATQPNFTVTSTTTSATVGDVLDKVGMATGWTTGEVTRTCVDLKRGPLETRERVLCQDEAHTFSFDGDSGSPVFVFLGATVQAHGILWGGRVHLFGRADTYLSPLPNVVLDLGGLTPVVP
ncbi:MAG: hypothetical protein JNL26_09510 [Gemmatimonadetes bacterium]|nr:hypothetical protein [Gemmatimonadota bacterium]